MEAEKSGNCQISKINQPGSEHSFNEKKTSKLTVQKFRNSQKRF